METKSPINVSIFLVLMMFLGLQFPMVSMGTVVCNPTTNGGTIGSDQVGTIGGFDPATLTNISSASGGGGTIEYKWMLSTVPVANTPGNSYWTEVVGETLSTFDPGMIYKTTYVIRVSKSNTCYDWGEESNMITLKVPSGPVSNCLVYGVQDKKSSDYSQLFTVDVFNSNQVRKFGPRYEGWDIEGLEIDKNTGILYGCSGNDNTHGLDGYFYSFDGVTGFINVIGATGYDDVVSLAFNSLTNILYAWVDDYGLITINTSTGAGTMVYSSPLDFDGMAWSNDGTILYVATDDKELFTFDPISGNLNLLTSNLPGPVESLEMRPDGNLLFGTHLASTTIYTINPQTLVINSANNIITPFDDIESIVWPEWCPLSINVNVQSTDVTCFNAQNGTVTISGSGGVAPYTYLWNTGSTLSSDTNLAPGTYSVVVTDANGVSEVDSFVISQPSAPLAVTLQTVQPTCTGNLTDGNISTLVTGGTAPFTYQWSNLANTSFTSGLGSGNHSVTITDANGCSVVTSTNIPTICCNVTNPGIIQGGQINCGSFDPAPLGDAISAAGGVGTVEYLWLQSTVNVPNTAGNPHWTMIPGSNSASYDPGTLSETTYFIRCARTSTCSFYAGESNIITIEINPEVNVNIASSTNSLCNGFGTGTAIANASGGTAPITYLWSNGDTASSVSGLAAGTYTVTATDSKGCDATAQVTITEPTVLTGGSLVTANVLVNGGSNGSATASANGGTTPYNYAWSTGDTGTTVSNLVAGSYSVTITDANGCSVTSTSVVTEPTTLTSTATVTSNVDCNGNANGSATTSANGAVSPYSYAWSTGATTATVNGLAAGTYSVVITDANGASNTKSVTVTEPTVLTGGSSVTANVLINGGSNGSATALANGGTTPYNYVWSTGDTGTTVSNLVAGSYSVTITDANGCSVTATSVVTEPTTLTSTATVTSNVDCNGNANGSATASANGAVSPYSYAWSTGATTATVNGLAAGTYSVVITDANGASNTKSVTVTEPTVLTGGSSVTANVLINGGSNGSATASANSGTTPYNYVWSTGDTGTTVSNLVAGSYSVTITDANGCSVTATSVVTEPTTLTSTATVTSNVDCNGNANGSATASANGAVSPYSYAWSTGATTATVNGLAAGTYSVVITDANGASNTKSVTVTEPTVLTGGSSVTANVLINGGSNGSATASANGGTTPYNYVWSSGDTGTTVSNLLAGSYTVTITDANGCSVIATSVVTEPTTLTSTATVTSNVDCNGNANGSATASANGAVSPYSYAWSTGATTATVNGLAAGTYSVVITDANGASNTKSVTVTEPTVLTGGSSVTANVLINGGSNGSVTATANGGTTPYNYVWSSGDTGTTVSNLLAGSYTVTITDANGCSVIATSVVTEPTTLTSTATVTSNVDCNGNANGSATASANGAVSPYSYAWSTGATTATVNGLAAGTYSVVITDANGASNTKSVTVTEPAVLAAIVQTAQATCSGSLADGDMSTLVNGGTAPFTYVWSTGATTLSVNGLVPGSYSVTVTDANGCVATASGTIATMCCNVTAAGSITGTQSNCGSFDPAPITSASLPTGGVGTVEYIWLQSLVNVPNTVGNPHWTMIPGSTSASYDPGTLTQTTYFIRCARTTTCTFYAGESNIIAIEVNPTVNANITTSTNASCNGVSDGTATVTATGGTAPFTYAWSNGATTATVSGLAAGTYTVTATDSKGCDATAQVTVTEPTVLTGGSSVTANVLINGGSNGSVTATANGGTTPYNYVWSTGDTGTTVSNVVAGSYSVTITDANGCSVTSTSVVTEPTTLTSTATVTSNVDCNGNANGSVTASANGAVSPYSYAWSTGATTATVNGLAAGTYSVVIIDANGASNTKSVTVTEPTVLTGGPSVTANVLINGGSNGSVTSSANGGTTPYNFVWSTGDTGTTVSNLVAGSYSVTITDANGCSVIATSVVTEPTTLTSTATVTSNVDCNGNANGSATASANGAISPYSYSWSTGATTATVTGLAAGTYSVVITDANGASNTKSVTITEPTVLIGGPSVTANVLINGGSNGSVTATANGGTTPYNYVWSTGDTGTTVSNLLAGSYTVTITDANGCSVTSTSVVTEPTTLTSTATVTSNVDCNGNANGSATASANGAVSPYSFAWSTGATTATVNGLAAGTYSVVITDANGASNTKSVTVTEPTVLTGGSSVTANVLINGGSNGSVTATANGGTTPYNYVWSTGDTGTTVSNLVAGSYSVTITDANGCAVTSTSVVTEPTTLTSNAVVYVNVDCNGNNTGEAGVSASGAVSPYLYAWSNGASTAAINNLDAGTYSVTVTDANGATSIKSVTVTEPNALLVSVQATQATCSGGLTNGQVNTIINGGAAPFNYSWSTGATSSSVSSLSPGSYSVTVTDANGCTAIGNGTIATMCCNVTSAGVIAGDQSNCGSFDPSVITSSSLPTGGVGNLEYVWLKSLVNVPNTAGNPHWSMIPNSNSATYDPGTITQTTYYLRCARRSNCSFYAGESNVITIEVNSGLTASLVQIETGCSNEMFEAAEGFNVFVKENITVKTNETEGAMALGGDLTLAGNYTLAGHTTGSFQDQGDAQNSALVVGGKVVYSGQSGMNVVNNGFVKICDVTGSNIHDWDTQNNQPQNTRISAGGYNTNPRINLSLHQSEASIENCPIDFNAAFTRLSATANSLAACSNNLNMNSTGPNRVAVTLASNTKNVLNVNWNDIKNLQEFKFNNQPSATSSILINVNNVNGGNISWNVPNFPGIGDQHGAYIIWNFINTPQITMTGGGTLKGTLLAPLTDVVDNNSGNIDGQLIAKSFYHNGGEMHNYLFAGNIEGCASGNCETPVNGTITICANETATIKAEGGDTYLWSTGATTAQTNLGVGSHSVTVTNAQGCSSVENVTIDSYALSAVSFNKTDVTCNGGNDGAADVTVTSGTGPFEYLWSTGDNGSSISGVVAGTYSVTITTGNGCEEVHQVAISESAPITANAIVVDNSCNSENTVCDLNLAGYVNGEVVTGSLPGLGITITSRANRGSLHDLIIFNTNLTGTRDSDLELNRGNILIFPENNVDNNNDGIYDLPDDTPQGGTVTMVFDQTRKVKSFDFLDKDSGSNGYAKAYDVNNNLLTSQPIVNAGDGSIQTISINKSGVKKLVIYYYNSGGIGNFQFDCSENPRCDGEINLAVNGGTAPYSYNWSNGATTQNVTNVCADQYAVTITDANGCSIVEIVDVYEPAKLTGQMTGYNATGRNRCDGYINVDFMQGGTPAYSYAWSNGETTEDISGLCKGTYVVTLTDQNGCMAKGGITLNTGGGVCGRDQYGNDNEESGISAGTEVSAFETSEISKSIYPNPTRSNFTVEFSTRQSGNIDVILYDVAGNMVEIIFSGYIDKDDIQIIGYNDAGSLAPGIYTVALKTEGATTFDKLIVQ